MAPNTSHLKFVPAATLFGLTLFLLCSPGIATAQSEYRTTEDGYPCGYCAARPRPMDEVYLVSTRCLPGGCGLNLPVDAIQVRKYEPGIGWQSIDWEGFKTLRSPGGLTSVYVHGNGMDTYWAQRRGWEMYHETTRRLSMDQPLKYVIWSWPTEPSRGPLKDARDHAVRAEDEAYYLASFLNQIDSAELVSISAFSMGAKSVMGACHLLGGGRLRGRSLDEISANNNGYRIVLYSAAITYRGICSSGKFNRALDRVDQLLNVMNGKDMLLKRYRFVTQWKGDEAAGYTGFSLTHDQRQIVRQMDAGNILGSKHSWDNVVCAYCVMERSRTLLQWKDRLALEELEPVSEGA